MIQPKLSPIPFLYYIPKNSVQRAKQQPLEERANKQFDHQLLLKWTCPASLVRIGYAQVRGEVIRHPPAPIFIP